MTVEVSAWNLPVKTSQLAAIPGRVEVFRPGQEIVRAGDPVDAHSKFYLIRRGTVEVVRDTGSALQKLTEMGPGRYFGEVALLMNQPRNATSFGSSAVAFGQTIQ